jgi:hypothetical protein
LLSLVFVSIGWLSLSLTDEISHIKTLRIAVDVVATVAAVPGLIFTLGAGLVFTVSS